MSQRIHVRYRDGVNIYIGIEHWRYEIIYANQMCEFMKSLVPKGMDRFAWRLLNSTYPWEEVELRDGQMHLVMSRCEVCLRESPAIEVVGVAAVPGAPMSLAWCSDCLKNNAQPLFMANVNGEDLPPGFENPAHCLSDWFLESNIYFKGGYMSIRDYYLKHWEPAR